MRELNESVLRIGLSINKLISLVSALPLACIENEAGDITDPAIIMTSACRLIQMTVLDPALVGICKN